MKKIWRAIIPLILVLFISGKTYYAKSDTLDYKLYTRAELETLQKDASEALTKYHEPSKSDKKLVLAILKTVVNNRYDELGYTVEWPKNKYEYERDWDYYSITATVIYKNNENSKDKGESTIWGEILIDDEEHAQPMFVTINEEIVLDDTKDRPASLQSREKDPKIINEATGINLAGLGAEELLIMDEEINSELESDHTVQALVSDMVISMTKYQIENVYNKVDWPEASFFGGNPYHYTNDWDFYTLRTTLTYRDASDKKQKADVYVEAYPHEDDYRIYFIQVGDDILVDHRIELPSSLYKVATKTSAGEETVSETEHVTEVVNETSIAASEQITELLTETIEVPSTEVRSETVIEVTSESTAMIKSETEEETEEKDLVLFEKGSRGDEVKGAQEKLIALGYLTGSADGIFGDMTRNALLKYQETKGLEQTGVITQDTWDKLSNEKIPETEKPAVQQTEARQTEVKQPETISETMVWIPNSGSKWHYRAGCSRMKNPRQVPLSQAEAMGYSPCSKCT